MAQRICCVCLSFIINYVYCLVLKNETNKVKLKVNIAIQKIVTIERK